LQPPNAKGQLDLSGFELSTVTSWLQDRLPVDLPSGKLDLHLNYQAVLTDPLQLKLDFPKLAFSGLAMAPRTTPATAPSIQIPSAAIEQVNVSLPDRSVTIGGIELAGSSVKAWRDSAGTINLQHLVTKVSSQAPTTTQADSKGAPWKINVGPVRLTE